jgi:hypothetical protein
MQDATGIEENISQKICENIDQTKECQSKEYGKQILQLKGQN